MESGMKAEICEKKTETQTDGKLRGLSRSLHQLCRTRLVVVLEVRISAPRVSPGLYNNIQRADVILRINKR